MASIYGEYSKYTRLRIDYTISQSIEDNTSTINMDMYAERTKASHQWVNSGSYYNMSNKGNTDFSYEWSDNSYELYIGSSSVIVEHNEDGTGSTTIRGYWNTYRTGSSYIPTELSISSTILLPTIARKSKISLSKTSVILGTSTISDRTIQINTNRASDTFVHVLYWQINNGNWNVIATGVGNNMKWELPNDIANNMPNISEGTVNIICETYNGNNYIGNSIVPLKVKISTSLKPSIGEIAIGGGLSGIYVETLSNVSVSVVANGIYGSTISSYKIEMLKEGKKIKEAVGSSVTFNLNNLNITENTDIELKVTVTDSRNNTQTKYKLINVKYYLKPTITSRRAYRCTSDGTSNNSGTYLYIFWEYSITAISGLTKDTAIVKYRRKGNNAWNEVEIANSSSIIISNISTDYQYEVQYSVSDGINSSETTIIDTIPTGYTTIDFKAGGKGIAFGKVSETDEFECNMVADFKNKITWNSAYYSNVDYNSITKSGTYYMTTNCTNAPENKSYCRLLVIGSEGSGDIIQIAGLVTTGETWIRGRSNKVWHNWGRVNQVLQKGIADDFNSIKTTGIYICGSTPTNENVPIDKTGILEVINNQGLILQRYSVYDGSLVFQRGYYNEWNNWRKVAGTVMRTNMASSRLTISGAAWSENIVTLNTTKTDTSQGLLELSNGGIKIGKSISTIKISASLSFYNYDAYGEVDLHILKNNEVIVGSAITNTVNNQIMTIVTNSVGINATKGDVISLSVVKNTAKDLRILEGVGTSLTVEAIN